MPLTIEAIVDREFSDYMDFVSGGDGIINYAIISKAGQYARNNYGVSSSEATGIRAAFVELDALTGLAFAETSPEEADIILYSVKNYKQANVTGQTEVKDEQFVATWKDFGGKRLTPSELSTIKHEIGHTLGLGHPYGDGYYEGVTSKDTIMSYNNARPIVTSYSTLDIQALQMLWGTPT